MGRISVISCFALLVVFLFYATELAESADNAPNERTKEMAPMWFGPRMGRKKRNPADINPFRNLDEQSTTFDLIRILRNTPVLVVAFKEVQNEFTPRMGRELEEASIEERSTNPLAITPRLGRTNYSPRLGRENDFLP